MKLDFVSDIGDYIFAEDELQPSDIIFVPGNGFAKMAEAAAKLYREGMAPYVLPSGKYSITAGRFLRPETEEDSYGADYGTEWEFLSAVLRKNGVPRQAILREDQATYTYENALFSREVLEKEGIGIQSAILCCRNLHARRALLYYQTVFPDVKIRVCPVTVGGITKENWTGSEGGVDAVAAEVHRILKQFSLMM